MSTRNKLHITAAAVLLLAVGILLRPSAPRPASASVGPAERSRPANRVSKTSQPIAPWRAKDFQTFAKLATKDQLPKLTRPEIDTYLEGQHRSAGSLLAAFRLSDDEAFLREAMEKFPHDTQVLLASLRLAGDPAKRLEVLETLKHSDPDNGIVDALSARALFDLGKNDEALAALSQSVGKPIRDYTVLSSQNTEEAYLSAGFSPLQAKMSSLFQSTKSAILEMRNVADGLKKQRTSAGAAGNDAAVQSSRDIQLQMAEQLRQGGFIVDSRVAMSLEKGVLREIDSPEARARMEEMEKQEKSMVYASKRVIAQMENAAVPENDWLFYFDRIKLFGQKAANDWMLEMHPDL